MFLIILITIFQPTPLVESSNPTRERPVHTEPQRPGQIPENQTEASYSTRSQDRFLTPREPLVRSESTHFTRNPALNMGSKPLPKQVLSKPSEVQPSSPLVTLYSTTGNSSQMIREKTETKYRKKQTYIQQRQTQKLVPSPKITPNSDA